MCAVVHVNKIWTNNRNAHVNEIKTKAKPSTSHSNWPLVLLSDLAHKQCNGIIEGQLHCLTSESKERFLVNNVLFGSSWCLVKAEIQFSLIKKKIWTSRTLANLPPPTSDNILFLPCPYPTPLLKVDVICVLTPMFELKSFNKITIPCLLKYIFTGP